MRGLVDEPTRILGLAARVAADPNELESALVALLRDCEITWHSERTAEGYTADAIVLADPAGGRLLIRRSRPPSTRGRTRWRCSPNGPP